MATPPRVHGTGRVVDEPGVRTLRVVYGQPSDADIATELSYTARVDEAHVIMLAEHGLISTEAAGALLSCIDELVTAQFRPLLSRPAPRGLYLMYEGYVVERLGPNIGGVLHTGRSRNDLKATITALRLRDWLLEFMEQAIRLEAVTLSRTRAYESVVMPVYTHYQAAMPITYGYYLLGLARGIGRDVAALRDASGGLRVCPLGASAAAGTDLPIDQARTAQLLGFDEPTQHALDAVASRDVPLRLLGAATGLSVTVSRLATDMQLWSTVEFGFIEFPDRLVGSSSAMPQKRNAFLLEHVRAKPAQAVGAWAAAAAAMAATPYTNTIEVGTEAVASVWHGLRAVEEAVLLSQVLISGARPVPQRMLERARTGFTTATSVANNLVRRGVPFRTAHRVVGEAVRQAVAAGSTELAAFVPAGWLDGIADGDLDPVAAVRAAAYGAGPGAFHASCEDAMAAWAAHRRWLADWRRSVHIADDARKVARRSFPGPATPSTGVAP